MAMTLGILMTVTSVFLILLVLVQRGRGGGLAGVLGGAGGQSAFGAKAGDLFTRITIGTATFWIVLCVFSFKVLGSRDDQLNLPNANPAAGAGASGEAEPGAGEQGPGAQGPAASGPQEDANVPASDGPAEP